ncbi:MAG: DUF1569 domain-containing protein [Leptospiraceae bacterium]|nr:DUF1569 domain-containing protein [Leptospiraceae bacterium]
MKTLKETLEFLKKLAWHFSRKYGKWTVGQTFLHLAQSIECSMIGYPCLVPVSYKKLLVNS